MKISSVALKAAGVGLATVIAFLGLPIIVAASQRHASDFVSPRNRLVSFEVYHVQDEGAMYRSTITVDKLIAAPSLADDYVKINRRDAAAIDALYSALTATVVNDEAPCRSSVLDVRWAIVLNYVAGGKDVVAFNSSDDCVQFIPARLPHATIVSSRDLLDYVRRTFPFMR